MRTGGKFTRKNEDLTGKEIAMCVALPGRVVKVNGTKATVDFSGNTMEAQAGLVKIKPGDSVLVHAGCILQVLTEQDRSALEELLKEIEEL
nr:HypC/HybG/HupF family hydrogenase formation chaperone [Caproiciproducens faecalis]